MLVVDDEHQTDAAGVLYSLVSDPTIVSPSEWC